MERKREAANRPTRRKFGPRRLSAILPEVTTPLARRRGFPRIEVLTRWAEIVGPELAQHCRPHRLAWPRGVEMTAVLEVRVASGFGPMVQHNAPVIIERINGFFGYRAVNRLRLKQGALEQPERPTPRRRRVLTVAERAAIDSAAATLNDPDLAAALSALGDAILSAEPR